MARPPVPGGRVEEILIYVPELRTLLRVREKSAAVNSAPWEISEREIRKVARKKPVTRKASNFQMVNICQQHQIAQRGMA
ncbi:hypothetical protein [Hyalangium rubrum]|uniref:Uncharacterized protein n=1 Tax=Hyalangium rubrum TaxID=3103134 RepID=A0ABU5H577_9BACT|nr:hypothetical protein [Hyalangium sp. s54d21]MDY7228647.1 hypothetical protein [Hyalangium sp. s54d21]